MTGGRWITRLLQQERVNFVLTNCIPRRTLTRFMGWFSRVEQPQIRALSIAVWRAFAAVDLSDARESRFRSLHACFTRSLKDNARPVEADPRYLASPCDGIIGACGRVAGDQLIQAKGHPFTLRDLLLSRDLSEMYVDGSYVVLRLTAGMYHRFHAPYDCHVKQVTYIGGDTWNVNPPALQRVEKLYCRNERALVCAQLAGSGDLLTLVAVGAVLVSSVRLHFLGDVSLRRSRPNVIPCNARHVKGQEMGWFEHGSTIIVLAPRGYGLCSDVHTGARIRMGQRLLALPSSAPSADGAAYTHAQPSL